MASRERSRAERVFCSSNTVIYRFSAPMTTWSSRFSIWRIPSCAVFCVLPLRISAMVSSSDSMLDSSEATVALASALVNKLFTVTCPYSFRSTLLSSPDVSGGSTEDCSCPISASIPSFASSSSSSWSSKSRRSSL